MNRDRKGDYLARLSGRRGVTTGGTLPKEKSQRRRTEKLELRIFDFFEDYSYNWTYFETFVAHTPSSSLIQALGT